MLNPDTAATAGRRIQQADERCLLCGEPGTQRHRLERHHIAGRANDPDLTGLLCGRCHRHQTESLRAVGVPMSPPAHPFDSLAALLGGTAEFLIELARTLFAWARWLTCCVAALDNDAPAWRDVLPTIPAVSTFKPVIDL